MNRIPGKGMEDDDENRVEAWRITSKFRRTARKGRKGRGRRRTRRSLKAWHMEKEWLKKSDGSWKYAIYLIMGGVVVGAVVMIGILPALQKQENLEKRTVVFIPPHFMEKSSAAEVKVEVERVVKGYLDASNHAERCEFVMGGEEMEGVMSEFLARPDVGGIPEGFGEMVEIQPASVEGQAMMVAVASHSEGGSASMYILIPTEDGMVIDWEATVCYGEMPWKEFLSERPSREVDMRVYLTRLPPQFSEEYPDEEYDRFEVSIRGHQDKLTSYVSKGTDLHTQLMRAVPPSGTQPVRLKLSWADGNTGKPEIKIAGLIHNYWVDFSRR